jgi:hypothetical protein
MNLQDRAPETQDPVASYDHSGNPVDAYTRLDFENRLSNDAYRFEHDADGNQIERWEGWRRLAACGSHQTILRRSGFVRRAASMSGIGKPDSS